LIDARGALKAKLEWPVLTRNPSDLLDSQQCADLLGIKPNTLEIWRSRGKGPSFIKFGTSPQAPVRYLRPAVMAWLEDQSYASTSAYSAAGRTHTKSHSCPPNRASA